MCISWCLLISSALFCTWKTVSHFRFFMGCSLHLKHSSSSSLVSKLSSVSFRIHLSHLFFCEVFPEFHYQGKLSVFLVSVQFSRSVVSDSLRPHESQHARPPCPSPSPGVHSDSRPSSPWCHPAISSSVVPFSSCPQSLPASKSFPVIQLFTWGGQSTGVSALASVLPKKSQGWSPAE